MGIDGIGKRPLPAPEGTVQAPAEQGRGAPAQRPFTLDPSVASTAAARTTGPSDVQPSALDRWKTGEIDIDRYLDLKVEEATRHLASLPGPELHSIRATLRDRLATDPALREMVQAATGRAPDPPPDE